MKKVAKNINRIIGIKISKSHKYTLIYTTIVIAIGVFNAGIVKADMLLSFSDEAGGTRVIASGNINTSGLGFGSPSASVNLAMNFGNGLIFTGGSGPWKVASTGQSVPVWHELNESSLSFSDASGQHFGFDGGSIVLPFGYISGSEINSSFLINGKSMNDINPSSGTVLTLNNGDTVSVIPEPVTLAFVGIFGGGLWFVRRFFPAV